MMETHKQQFLLSDLERMPESELAQIIGGLTQTQGVMFTQQGTGESAVITFYWRSESEDNWLKPEAGD